MSCASCQIVLAEIRELKELVAEIAGQGRDEVPAHISLSHKAEFQAMLARRAHLDELARKRKSRKGR